MKHSLQIGLAVVLLFASAVASAQEFGPWSPPVNLGPTVNSAADDMHPTLSKDGLSLIFSSTRPGGAGGLDLWVSQRDSLDSPWQPPQNLTMLNSPFADYSPNLTTDGHWLFFHSNRPGDCSGDGRFELWAAHRQHKRDDFGWEPPINLGCTLNIPGADDAGPNFWEDDETGTLHLYFTRNLTPANANGFDIYVSTCTSDLDSCNRQQLWGPGAYVAESAAPDFAPRAWPSGAGTAWKCSLPATAPARSAGLICGFRHARPRRRLGQSRSMSISRTWTSAAKWGLTRDPAQS